MAIAATSLLMHLAEVQSTTEQVKLQPTALVLLQKRRLTIISELQNVVLIDEPVCQDAKFIICLFGYLRNRDYANWSYQECLALANLVALVVQACKGQKLSDLLSLAADCFTGLKEFNHETNDVSACNLLASLCLQRRLFPVLGKTISSLLNLAFSKCLAALKTLKSHQEILTTRACILECLALMQAILQLPPKYTSQADRSVFALTAAELIKATDLEIAFEAFKVKPR
jgi:hypothetical protein